MNLYTICKAFAKKDHIKIHTLNSGYWGTDTRLLHGCFQLLVDYVEIDLASRRKCMILFRKGGITKWLFLKTPEWLEGFLFPTNNKELGIGHLDWEMEIPDKPVVGANGEITHYGCPGQAKYAKEIKTLYIWWKEIYPSLETPMDRSGLSAFYDKHRSKLMLFRRCKKTNSTSKAVYSESYNDLTEEEDEEYIKLIRLCANLEADDLKKEKEMLKRLIDIKEAL